LNNSTAGGESAFSAAPQTGRKERALAPPAFLPEPPETLDQIDIPQSMLMDLAVRHISTRGTLTIRILAGLMKLPLGFTELLFRRLREQQYLEIKGTSGEDYVFCLNSSGRNLAAERSLFSRYAGPAPVSLKSWVAAVRAQAAHAEVTREKLRRAYCDIVVEDKLLDALGPALISRNAIFFYGPSGTGKTSIAERLLRIFDDSIVVPWAVEVDGQIIMVADPVVHHEVVFDEIETDPRWMICKRPFLAVGGELVMSMLDLQKNGGDGSFSAPLQMKANNGMLLIDDFGRQMVSPRDLLNRWIVPLDRRVDFLSFGAAGKFDIPFELQIVFSTNLAPHELADEAFLRRIPNKILVEAIGSSQFDAVFRMTAEARSMPYEAGSEELLRELCLRFSPDLRPCFPRDIFNMIRAISLYEHREPAITHVDLKRAAEAYFV
jgi:hypothetical protein